MVDIIMNKNGTFGRTEEFKRPSHPDFCDTSELKKQKFSGVRHNKILDSMEIWIEGEIKTTMTVAEMVLNPAKWEAAYADAFSLYDVKTK